MNGWSIPRLYKFLKMIKKKIDDPIQNRQWIIQMANKHKKGA